jgi:hypothetical protein
MVICMDHPMAAVADAIGLLRISVIAPKQSDPARASRQGDNSADNGNPRTARLVENVEARYNVAF